jgi:vitamin B12 transporter
MIRRAWFALAVLSGSALQLLHAQVADTVVLPEVVVTANRVATPPAEVIPTTTVISGKELRERGIRTVAEALLQVPGAAVVPVGSYGGVTSLFLRGGESDYVKVLVDGVPQNEPGGTYFFSNLTTDNVERIEVVQGPVSVLYGSDAMTGVIQIFTRKGTGPSRVDAEALGGSFGSFIGSAGARGGSASASYSATLSRYSTDGTYPFNDRYVNNVGSAALHVRLDERTDGVLSVRGDGNTTHYPTDFTGAATDSNSFTTGNVLTVGLDLGHQFTDKLELRGLVTSNRQSDRASNTADSPGDTLGFYDTQSLGNTYRNAVDVHLLVRPRTGMVLTFGAGGEYEGIQETDGSISNFGFGTDSSASAFNDNRNNWSGYAQGLAPFGDRVVATIGVRLDDNGSFGTHFTDRAGVAVRLLSATRLRASYGTAFKEPTFREVAAQTPFEVGNPDLKPEQARSWEAGVSQELLAGRLRASVAYFNQQFQDMIEYDANVPPGTPNYYNVAEATADGWELQVEARPIPALSIAASYTNLFTRVDEAVAGAGPGSALEPGQPLLRRPDNQARMDIRAWPVHGLSLGAGLTWVGDRDDIDYNAFPAQRVVLPAYFTADFNAAYTLPLRGPALTLEFQIQNAFDEVYQTVVGYPGRPRAMVAGAKVEF